MEMDHCATRYRPHLIYLTCLPHFISHHGFLRWRVLASMSLPFGFLVQVIAKTGTYLSTAQLQRCSCAADWWVFAVLYVTRW